LGKHGGNQPAGETQPSTGQARFQQFAGARQSRLHGPFRTTKEERCFLIRSAFHVAQSKGQATASRQFQNFFVEHEPKIAPYHLLQRIGRTPGWNLTLARSSLPHCDLGSNGDAMGNAVQPARYRLLLGNRLRIAHQDKKRRLEYILRILSVVQHPLTNREHQRAVPLKQAGKSRLVVPIDELPQ
jgi:hypothetical protein